MKHLRDLAPDPQNARKHNPRNLGMLERSLREVGAARSIVIDEHGTVLAGNATIEAAAAAGIENVRVIETDGNTIIAVRRSNLTPEQARKLALYDNRTAELAEWDEGVLKQLAEQAVDCLSGLWSDSEVKAMLGEHADTAPQLDGLEHKVLVRCANEEEQASLIERLQAEGYQCQALTL